MFGLRFLYGLSLFSPSLLLLHVYLFSVSLCSLRARAWKRSAGRPADPSWRERSSWRDGAKRILSSLPVYTYSEADMALLLLLFFVLFSSSSFSGEDGSLMVIRLALYFFPILFAVVTHIGVSRPSALFRLETKHNSLQCSTIQLVRSAQLPYRRWPLKHTQTSQEPQSLLTWGSFLLSKTVLSVKYHPFKSYRLFYSRSRN